MGSDKCRAVLGSPLMQVFSFSIKPDGDFCQLYGTIQVIDDTEELYLYNRDPNDAETIHKYGKISLLYTDRAISAAADITVNLDLKERNGNMELIKESFSLNGPNMFSYANCLSHDFRGKLGVATMYFSVLSVALDTTYFFELFKSRGSGGANVHGKIVTYYGSNFSSLVDDNLKEHFRFTLFDTKPEEAVRLEDGGLIPLLEDFVCVPSYSSLVFQGDLYYTFSSGDDNKEEYTRIDDEITAWEDIFTRVVHDAFVLEVNWRHPNRIARSPSLEMIRMDNFHTGLYKIIELFSVRIFYDQRTVEGDVEVHGTIRADDGRDMSVFSSKKEHRNRILPDGTLALTGPTSAIQGSNFTITLEVKETHQKFVLDGWLILTPKYMWDWPDCLTCAALSGKDCYAVLHFAIFHGSVQAHVEVTLFSGRNTTIYGSLIAYYANFEYKSDYLRTYFRTRLLDVPEDKPMKVFSDMLEDVPMPESDDEPAVPKNKLIEVGESSVLSNVTEDEVMTESNDEVLDLEDAMMQPEDEPVELKDQPDTIVGTRISLSRNVVAVPNSSSLIIEANLSCNTRIDNLDSVTQLVKGVATFTPQTSGFTSGRIGDKDVFINVKVSWSKDWFNTPDKLPIETKRHSSVEVSSEKKIRLG